MPRSGAIQYNPQTAASRILYSMKKKVYNRERPISLLFYPRQKLSCYGLQSEYLLHPSVRCCGKKVCHVILVEYGLVPPSPNMPSSSLPMRAHVVQRGTSYHASCARWRGTM